MHPENCKGAKYTEHRSSEGGMRVEGCLALRRLGCLQIPPGLPEGKKMIK